MHTWKWIVVLTSLSWVACGGGGGGAPDSLPQDNPPPAEATDDGVLQIEIAGPSITGTHATSASEITLQGRVPADVETIEWKNLATGASGLAARGARATGTAMGTAMVAATEWSAPVPLGVGDNPIVVTARRGDQESRSFLFAVRDPLADGLGTPRLEPSGVLVGQSTPVTITVAIPEALAPIAVEAWRVEADGTPIEKITSIWDDGDIVHADETAGDGTYSGVYTETASAATLTLIRILALHGNGTIWGLPVVLHAAEAIDPAAFTASVAVQDAARRRYDELLATSGRDLAIGGALALLRESDLVAEAGRSGAAGGIWIVFEAGFLGGLLLGPPGTKGGSDDGCPTPPATFASFRPFADEFQGFFDGKGTEATTEEIYQLLAPCQGGASFEGPLANLAGLRAAARRGVLIVSSHGDSWYGGARSNSPALRGARGGGLAEALGQGSTESVAVVGTDGIVGPQTREAYMTDLVLGRLVIFSRGGNDEVQLAITPAYVHAHLDFSDTFIHVSACRSAFNATLAHACLAKGAQTFVGYDDYVSLEWATATEAEFFNGLAHGKTLGEALVPGTGPRGASLRHWGDPHEKLNGKHIANPSFERGLESWDGTATVVESFGEIAPPDTGACNRRMAKIATGGALSQEICIPEQATEITFRYDFVSQALGDVCEGLRTPAIVEVTFTPNDASLPVQVLLRLEESSLCGNASAIAGDFDGDGEVDGADFLAWQTGFVWYELEDVIVSSLKGKTGVLTIALKSTDPGHPAVLLVDEFVVIWEDLGGPYAVK